MRANIGSTRKSRAELAKTAMAKKQATEMCCRIADQLPDGGLHFVVGPTWAEEPDQLLDAAILPPRPIR